VTSRISRIDPERHGALLALAAIVVLVLLAGLVRLIEPDGSPERTVPEAAPRGGGVFLPDVAPPPDSRTGRTVATDRPGIFDNGRFLVAYYGTAGTGSLGVLGETDPEPMFERLRHAARPFKRAGHPVRLVYELIVTVADRSPGPDGSFSHDIDRDEVEKYVESARRHHALLLLDVQPGHSDFLDVAKRWQWALEEPHVGLALDPEWRMNKGVPGTVIGSVRAYEVNRTARWLSQLTHREGLPEKLLVLHQFRSSMIEKIGQIGPRANLAMVQHVDGFGTPGQKLATYHAVARPGQFTMGFKLFYDEDVRRMGPAEVHRLRPDVRFVSFQ
jgi:hypothetical protein